MAKVHAPPNAPSALRNTIPMMMFAARSEVSMAEPPCVRSRAGKLSEA